MNSVKDIFDKMSIEHRPIELPKFDPSTIKIESEVVENRSSWLNDKYIMYETYQKMAKIMDSKGCPGSQYFDYYSSLILRDTFEPVELQNNKILLKYDDFSFTLASAIVAPALASGKTVVVKAIENKAVYFIKLLQNSGLPSDMLYSMEDSSQKPLTKFYKTIYIGDKQTPISGSEHKIFTSLSHLVPQQTGALLLETCDMEAAVDSIIISTWVSSDLCGFFGVSTVVVQQAVFDKFLRHLKTQLNKFSNNYKHSKFHIDESMIEKMKILIETAKMNGAEVITNNNNNSNNMDDDDKWNPTVLLNYNRKLPSFCRIINVLTCRTPNEGIRLLNDHSLETGISVWTENPSLAMEMASNANCYHVWVNCHGCISPGAPLYTCRYVLGGEAGLYQYLEKYVDIVFNLNYGNESNFEKELTLIESTKESMKLWQKEKNKITHLKNLIGSINKSFDLSLNSKVLQKYLTLRSLTPSPNDNNPKHYCIEEILPIGLVAIYIDSYQFKIDVDFVEMVLAVLGRGNGIIFFGFFVENLNNFVHALKTECKNVPISVKWDRVSSRFLSKSHFQDVWSVGSYYLEPIGPIPDAKEMSTRCYKSKVIWIPKIDQFP